MNLKRLGWMVRIGVVMLLTAACTPSSPDLKKDLKKDLTTGQIPRFEGSVRPIREPLYPSYRPSKGSFHHSILQYTKYPNKESFLELTREIEMKGNYLISELNQFLIWLIRVDQMIVDETPYKPSAPLVETTILTDRQGKVAKIDLAAPALSRSNLDDADIEKYIESAMQSIAFLSKGPIRSGDIITELSGNILPDKLINLLKKVDLQLRFEYRVEGWSTYEDRKVIVTALKENYRGLSDKSRQVTIDVRMNGYNLYDAETYQVLKGVRLMEIDQTLSNGSRYNQKMLFHQTTEFTQ